MVQLSPLYQGRSQATINMPVRAEVPSGGSTEEDRLLFFFFNFYLFIYFWLHWFFVAARGLSLVAASGGYSSLRCTGFSLWWLLLLRSTGSRYVGFSNCSMWAQ